MPFYLDSIVVYRLVENLITESLLSPGRIAFSPDIAMALIELKNFNRKNIYFNPRIKKDAPKIRRLYRILFETFLEDFRQGPFLDPSVHFLDNLDHAYRDNEPPEVKARDLLATMTDDDFLHVARELTIPKWRNDSI
jgi:dGTP triphosphohydrolase